MGREDMSQPWIPTQARCTAALDDSGKQTKRCRRRSAKAVPSLPTVRRHSRLVVEIETMTGKGGVSTRAAGSLGPDVWDRRMHTMLVQRSQLEHGGQELPEEDRHAARPSSHVLRLVLLVRHGISEPIDGAVVSNA